MNRAQTARSDLDESLCHAPLPPPQWIVTLVLHVQRRLQSFSSARWGRGRGRGCGSGCRVFKLCVKIDGAAATIENQTMRTKVGKAKPLRERVWVNWRRGERGWWKRGGGGQKGTLA